MWPDKKPFSQRPRRSSYFQKANFKVHKEKPRVRHCTVEVRPEKRSFYATAHYYDKEGRKHSLVKELDSNVRRHAEREARYWSVCQDFRLDGVYMARKIQRKGGLQPKTQQEMYMDRQELKSQFKR